MTYEELHLAMRTGALVALETNRAAQFTVQDVVWREPGGEALVLIQTIPTGAVSRWEIGAKLVPVTPAL